MLGHFMKIINYKSRAKINRLTCDRQNFWETYFI